MVINKNIMGWSAALLVTVIWGLTGVVAKPLAEHIDTFTLVFFRYVTAVIGLSIIFIFTCRNRTFNTEFGSTLKVKKNDLLKIAFCGIVGQGCYSFFNFLSLSYIGATENGVVHGMQPFATVIFGMLFMGFKMNRMQFLAFILSAIGIYTITTYSLENTVKAEAWKGYVFVTLSMLSVGLTSYLRDKLAISYGSVVSMLYQYIFVMFTSFILVLYLGTDLSQIFIILNSPLLLGCLIFIGTIISGLSYVIQLFSFKYIGVENSVMTLNLMPLVSYIMAVITLGESFNFTTSFCIILIIVSLFMFTGFGRKNITP